MVKMAGGCNNNARYACVTHSGRERVVVRSLVCHSIEERGQWRKCAYMRIMWCVLSVIGVCDG